MNQRLLRLVVLNERVIWELFKCDLEGNRLPLSESDRNGIPLDLDPEQLRRKIKTISLLADLQQLVADMRRSAKWDADVIEAIACRVVEALGEQLYGFLFPTKLAQVLNDTITATVDGLLRIELEFQGEALKRYGNWPWEYLRSPLEEGVKGSGEYLALRAQLVLNRRLFLGGEVAAMKTGRPSVLLVVAGPPGRSLGDFGVVQADKVVRTLHDLRDANVIDLIELVEPEFQMSPAWAPTASWDAFKRIVKDRKPDVIHFIGHGQRVYDPNQRAEHSELVFVGPGCAPDPQRDADFVLAIGTDPNLKLVFLQACESGVPGPHASATSVGQLLAHNGIPAVVAMQAKVENIVANDFAEAFYKALREHKPVDWAVREGREAIQNVSPALKLAFGVPVLFLRSYEALISAAEIPKTPSTVPTRPFDACPRCGSRDITQACPDCGLRVVCGHVRDNGEPCATPLVRDPNSTSRDNPMKPFCRACGTASPQPRWTPAAAVDLTTPRPKFEPRAQPAPTGATPNVTDLLSTMRQSGSG